MNNLHVHAVVKPKWFKVTINRSRIIKFFVDAYLGNNSEDDKPIKKNQLPGVGERL
ncbi:MAG TPA: hypothetical protein VFU05_08455 [Cyclobacteriaceae bacterium]|nr:hypothetical protein [Cyclobacteriaceae bacterium]